MFSLYAIARCGGSATVHSFEPIPSTHSVLAANCNSALSGSLDAVLKRDAPKSAPPLRWKAHNVGLSDTTSHPTFAHHPHFSVWSTADEGFAAARLKRILADLPRATK